jgi:hypothetical protein
MGVIWIDSGRFAVAAGGWTPAQISPALWLDASDSNTLFAANTGSTLATVGGAVGRWEDKSGSARHVSQATPENRPTLISPSGVNFSSASHILAGNVINSTTLSFYYVTSDRAGAVGLPVYNGDASNDGLGPVHNYRSGKIDVLYGGIVFPLSSLTQNVGVDTIVGFRRSASAIAIAKNGTAGTISTSSIPKTPTLHFSVGQNGSGVLREAIVASSYLADSVGQQIEGYLAWKWGLAANLPAGHPYKSAAP